MRSITFGRTVRVTTAIVSHNKPEQWQGVVGREGVGGRIAETVVIMSVILYLAEANERPAPVVRAGLHNSPQQKSQTVFNCF